jgi:hypothetical protein
MGAYMRASPFHRGCKNFGAPEARGRAGEKKDSQDIVAMWRRAEKAGLSEGRALLLQGARSFSED